MHFSDNARVQEWLSRLDATGLLGRVKDRAGEPSPVAPAVRQVRRFITVLLVLGVCGFLIDGANRPTNPRLVPVNSPTGTVTPMSPVTTVVPSSSTDGATAGMRSAWLTVSASHRGPSCVLEAVTTTQQEHGLMDRTSVAPYAGMAFVFDSPSTDQFYMKDTLIPLSIAWFGSDGRFINETEMPPCPSIAVNCPTYEAAAPYELALEVPAGQLAGLGIGPGAMVHLGASCA